MKLESSGLQERAFFSCSPTGTEFIKVYLHKSKWSSLFIRRIANILEVLRINI